MGNHQSDTTTSDQEVVTGAKPGAKKENTNSHYQKVEFGLPVTNDDKQPLKSGNSAVLTLTSDVKRMPQDYDVDKRKSKHADKVIIAKVDSIPKSKPRSVASMRTDPYSRKKKKLTWIPWKKKKEHKPMVTIGLTMKLDSKHCMLIYLLDHREATEDNEKKVSEETITTANLPEQCSAIFGDDKKPTRTKLLVKEMKEMRGEVSMKMKGRRDHHVDPSIVCGLQLYAMRHYGPDIHKAQPESAPQSRLSQHEKCGYIQHRNIEGMNVLAPTMIESQKFQKLMSICSDKILIAKDGELSSTHSAKDKNMDKNKIYDLSGFNTQFSEGYSAIVPRGIGKHIFIPDRVINNMVDSVEDMICIDQESHVYVCDIGLTPAQCDFITDTTERCSQGHYAAYTYAKQTLGCRDHDELAVLCEWPVMRAYSSIIDHLEKRLKNKDGSSLNRQLVFDEREPHLVKYDTSKKERQKLDMHTDKSEWTFLIALSDGDGGDYDGGGTYIECIDTTVHLQKGHALIFPGKRRHRGQKIVHGLRFLLVGFLVEKQDLDKKYEEVEAEYEDYLESIF